MVDRGRARDVNEAAARFAETLADSYSSSTGGQPGRLSASNNAPKNSPSLCRATSRSGPRLRKRPAALRAGRQTAGGQAGVGPGVRRSLRGVPQYRLLPLPVGQRAGSRRHPGGRASSRRYGRGPGGHRGRGGRRFGGGDAVRGGDAGLPNSRLRRDERREEASKRLNDLSVEELRLVRDHEESGNKARETLLEQMDRKIRAS